MTNLKPYRQHEYVAGGDYQITKDWAIEARYDRRRLDHVIEDASLSAPCCFEYYNIVNPGEGVNKTLDGYASYLRGLGSDFGLGVPAFDPGNGFDPTGICANGACPNNPTAIRNYDGVEVRLTKAAARGWAGMFSYTWSRLWGNYTGLTTTDQLDGGTTGRDSPNTTRAFDEPIYYFNYQGKSNAGPLPTDRPNAFKGNVYYTLPSKLGHTTIGLFQVAYQGSPVSSWADVGYGVGSPIEGTYIWGHGNYVNATSDPTTGAITLGSPYARRTPWFIQSDLNVEHSFKLNKSNERQQLTISGTLLNLFNQHSVVSYWEGLNSDWLANAFFQGQIFTGANFYKEVETGYNPQAIATQYGVIQNSQYGLPNVWQPTRNIRIAAKFTF
ncbi:MAG TPA: TonB-dependent receptor, partial [Candidatus Binatia bacterium]|nr:TonB-dependent receptor [Candidatus Binatia bacterium]